jgi:DNA-binding transcriptional LysR family regulator
MKINSFKIFINLVDLGSYSKTAEKLNITQPAVSMQIKNLEEKFSADLIYKEKGQVKLTPAGNAIYTEGKKILKNWDNLLNKVEINRDRKVKELNIASSTIPSQYFLPELLTDLSQEMPGLKTKVEIGNSEAMIEKLEKREVDLIIVGYKPNNRKFKVVEAAEDSLSLIIPKNHPLSKKEKVFLADLKEEKFLLREEGSGTRKILLEGLKKVGLNYNDLNIISELGCTEAVIASVQAGAGISFISKLASEKNAECGRVGELEVEDLKIHRYFYVAFHSDRENDPIIREFLEFF